MQTIQVIIPGQQRSYDIHIGSGLFQQAESLLGTSHYTEVIVITDQTTERLWLPKLRQALPHIDGKIVLPPGEQEKRIENVERIWSAMLAHGCDRKSLAILIGGGVIGDMGAFAASTFMRGMDFVHIPTTLLAQVDSSIGGKTMVNFGGIKNIVGAFSQPAAVLIDTDTLETLPARQRIAAFAEMFKHGLIRDAAYFEQLAQKHPLEYNAHELTGLINTSVGIKISITTQDEEEQGSRKLVNFGHTVGHAVEALSWKTNKPLLHGEAVAIGMVVEARLSEQKGYISADDIEHIRQVLSKAGLPTKVPDLRMDQLLEKMHADKKNEHGTLLFTLLQHIGEANYNQPVDEDLVVQAIEQNRKAE